MTKVCARYPNSQDVKLEMVHSKKKHTALLSKMHVTNNLKGLELNPGIAGVTPSDFAPYSRITHLHLKTLPFLNIMLSVI